MKQKGFSRDMAFQGLLCTLYSASLIAKSSQQNFATTEKKRKRAGLVKYCSRLRKFIKLFLNWNQHICHSTLFKYNDNKTVNIYYGSIYNITWRKKSSYSIVQSFFCSMIILKQRNRENWGWNGGFLKRYTREFFKAHSTPSVRVVL